eukprot:Clim_evm36s246 gene=Clim_evmTU36s246
MTHVYALQKELGVLAYFSVLEAGDAFRLNVSPYGTQISDQNDSEKEADAQAEEEDHICITCSYGRRADYNADDGSLSGALRAHVRTAWHAHNAKRRAKGMKSISEDEFKAMKGTAEETAMYDEDKNEEEEESDESDNAVMSDHGSDNEGVEDGSRLRKKSVDVEEASTSGPLNSRVFFRAQIARLPRDVQKKVLGAIKKTQEKTSASRDQANVTSVPKDEDILFSLHLNLLGYRRRDRQRNANDPAALLQSLSVQKVAVFMASSGNFAGGLFEGLKMIEHRTARRYTVRGKRGTAQSTRDAGGKKPKSVGAYMRRQGEVMLKNDIQGIMTDWADWLENEADMMFIYAPGNVRGHFFADPDGEGEKDDVRLLNRNDPRLRSLPVVVKKPTLELVEEAHARTLQCWVHDEATIAKHHSDAIAKAREAAERRERLLQRAHHTERNSSTDLGVGGSQSGLASPGRGTSHLKDKNSAEESPSNQAPFLDAVHNGDLEQVNALIAEAVATEHKEDEDLTPLENLFCQRDERTGQTALHKACSRHSRDEDEEFLEDSTPKTEQLIRVLLSHGADPTLKDYRGQVPYQGSRTRIARDALRKFAAEEPELWPWLDDPSNADGGAGLPSLLDAETLRRRDEREKERARYRERAQKRAEQRRAAEKAKEEAARAQAVQAERQRKQHQEALLASRLEKESRMAKFRAMSDREKRAYAAEQRIAASQRELTHCSFCDRPLPDDKSEIFSRQWYRYCSSECSQWHQKAMDNV